ncbi:hypothetical protein AB0I39_28095 [Kitasatospora purpeofusca]
MSSRSRCRSPDRMRGQVVIGGIGGTVVMVVAGPVQFLTDHIQVIVR